MDDLSLFFCLTYLVEYWSSRWSFELTNFRRVVTFNSFQSLSIFALFNGQFVLVLLSDLLGGILVVQMELRLDELFLAGGLRCRHNQLVVDNVAAQVHAGHVRRPEVYSVMFSS